MSHHHEWIVVFEGGPPSSEVIMSQQKRPVHKSSQLGCVISTDLHSTQVST